MSNEQVLERGYEALARGDMQTLADTWADDFILHVPGSNRLSGDYHGKDAALAMFAEQARLAGESGPIEVQDILVKGDRAVVFVERQLTRGDRRVRLRGLHVHVFDSGKIVESWSLPFDQAELDAIWS